MIAMVERRNVAPVSLVRCPAHGSLVALDGDGRLLGRCDGCVTEVASGLRRLALMPAKGATV